MAPEVRTPQQRRSREKYAAILRTAADLLQTVRYDELGTTRIAAAAGVSVGVLYRFFPDKEAIVRALVRQWWEADIAWIEELAARPPRGDAGRLLDELLARYADRFRHEPGYRNVWFHAPPGSWTQDDGPGVDARIVDHLHAILTGGYGLADTPETRLRTRLAVELGDRVLQLAFRDDPDGDPEILADGVLMMERYLFAPLRHG